MFGKGVFLLVFVFLLMMYILVATTNSMFILQQKASLQVVEDPVQVQKKGTSTWTPVRGLVYVTAGDEVRTGAAGQAELRWIGPTRVVVDSNTSLQVRQALLNRLSQSGDSILYLRQGKIAARVVHRPEAPEHLQVRTATANVAVQGTIFSVSVERDALTQAEATTVEVFSGQVAVRDLRRRKHRLTVHSQQRVRLASQVPSPLLRPLGPQELSTWQKQEILRPYLHVPWASIPSHTFQERLTLTGQTEPQATVTINRQPVSVNRQGVFSGVVPLRVGINEIEIVARDPLGYLSRVQRTVVRVEASPPASPSPKVQL
jgi:hypothetical protein